MIARIILVFPFLVSVAAHWVYFTTGLDVCVLGLASASFVLAAVSSILMDTPRVESVPYLIGLFGLFTTIAFSMMALADIL